MCVFDFLLAPVMLIMGVWRANEYFYVARLIMWSMLIPQGEALFTRITKGRIKARWYRIALCLAFFAWLGFRILSEWDDLRIMPYLFNFFVKGE